MIQINKQVILDNVNLFVENETYIVNVTYNLQGNTYNMPANVTLKIGKNGGFVNGTLVGNNTTIDADDNQIFGLGDNLTLNLRGTYNIGCLKPQWFGTKAEGKTDSTTSIQHTIDQAYYIQKEVYFKAGVYLVFRAIFVYDGIKLRGDGIYNTVLKSPFGKSTEAKAYVNQSKGAKKTVTDYDSQSFLDWDYSIGHNRFYLGDGNVGYYDSDRDSNPNHPLYYPRPTSAGEALDEWNEWNTARTKIQNQGRFIGATGREGYADGLIKCSQLPGLFYPSRGESGYKAKRPGGIVHTGVRNVKISDMQINTNSSDRGKDSGINFKYKATSIPVAIRDTYDSSVLNCCFESLYIFGCGRDGISATRAVDFTIINCYIRQCAEIGINLDGVTSIFITGCYCNSCLTAGYKLNGVNYSVLSGCASDYCGISYNIRNCRAITLNSCGSEATRLQLVQAPDHDEGEIEHQDLNYVGRSFLLRSCLGVTLNSCYAMAAHTHDNIYAVHDAEEDIYDTGWETNTFVYINESSNVTINNCYWKAFRRVRSAPYRNADNIKCNYQGGTYDPSQPGSRYWQMQNYMPGQIYDVRSDNNKNKTTIVCNRTELEERKELEIRWGNLDIYDPGIVPNPNGYSTAGKCISGRDNKGGWYYTDDGENYPITLETFEVIFPINGKHSNNTRMYWWEWRNSLKLVRIKTDDNLIEGGYTNGASGYRDIAQVQDDDDTTVINLSDFTQEQLAACTIDIVNDYSNTSFIDGSKSYFGYGELWKENLRKLDLIHKFFTPIPAHVRNSLTGHRTIMNTNDYKNIPTVVAKSSVAIVGNIDRPIGEEEQWVIDNELFEESDFTAGNILSLLYPDSLQNKIKTLFGIYNKDGEDIFSISNDSTAMLNAKGFKFLSPTSAHTSDIKKLSSSASTTSIINKINALIDRLTDHGFVIPEEVPTEIVIRALDTDYTATDTEITINFQITSLASALYLMGASYSSNNTSPTARDHNHVDAANVEENDGIYTGTVTITKNQSQIRYIRLYYQLTNTAAESARIYSETYLWSGTTLTLYNG